MNITKGFIGTAILVQCIICAPSHADTNTSVNFGWVSEYLYRGIPQDDSSAFVGIDFESSGFYLGSWAADVGQGSEVDVYLGYGANIGDDFNYSLGFTGYYYTDDFDDTYEELNVSLAYLNLTLDAAFGEYGNFSAPTLDYSFYSLTGEYKDAYLTVGSFGQDFNGEYIEAGYETEVSGFDVGVSIVHGTSSLVGESDTSIVFGISKTLTLK